MKTDTICIVPSSSKTVVPPALDEYIIKKLHPSITSSIHVPGKCI